MTTPKTAFFGPGGFFKVSREEVARHMRRRGFCTITEAMRDLFPDLVFYRCGGGNTSCGRLRLFPPRSLKRSGGSGDTRRPSR